MSSNQSSNPNYQSSSFNHFLNSSNCIIYHLYGPAGSGKSNLLKEYRQIAEPRNFIVASLDRIPQDEVDAMQQFVTQISKSTLKLDREVCRLIDEFHTRCEEYRQLKQPRAEETPQEEQQEPSLLSSVASLGRSVIRQAEFLSAIIKISDILPPSYILASALSFVK